MTIKLAEVKFTSNLMDPAMSQPWERNHFKSDAYDLTYSDGIITVVSKKTGRAVQSNSSCHWVAEASVTALEPRPARKSVVKVSP